jgi:formylglycine-generating enzyme required for sulfatase activity
VRANADLATQGWVPLAECTNDDPPNSAQPPCSMSAQHLRCDSLLIVNQGGRLELALGARTAVLAAPRGAVRSVPDANGGLVDVRSCVSQAWLDAGRRLLVVALAQACQGAAGDWCVAPTEWHVVPVPLAPSARVDPPDAGASCRAGMTPLSGGAFAMGDAAALPGERTVHRETVASFCMDTAEVTVDGYAACVKAHRCPPPAKDSQGSDAYCTWNKAQGATRPINCVTWSDADAFCRWQGKRLPTEIEWEYATRGSEGRAYAWGSGPPGADVCWNRARDSRGFLVELTGSTCPAGASGADRTPAGIADLGGNISEWTASLEPDPGYPSGTRVVRGGAWSSTDARYLRGAHRSPRQPSVRGDDVGFRCALDGAR